jgi:hypothetical protein
MSSIREQTAAIPKSCFQSQAIAQVKTITSGTQRSVNFRCEELPGNDFGGTRADRGYHQPQTGALFSKSLGLLGITKRLTAEGVQDRRGVPRENL